MVKFQTVKYNSNVLPAQAAARQSDELQPSGQFVRVREFSLRAGFSESR